MSVTRKINEVLSAKLTIEGAGVHLYRVFGFKELPRLDPFLMMDDFRCNSPDEFMGGFPWHPHRGFETITYVLDGSVEHADSLGNKGVIGPGDVQWMTAGSGIIHQEMPLADKDGKLGGFQLWANLPSSSKMMDPKYRNLKSSQIPEVKLDNGVIAKVICGEIGGVSGPVKDIVTDPGYLDITVPPDSEFDYIVKNEYKVLAYMIEGSGDFGELDSENTRVNLKFRQLAVFGTGDVIKVKTNNELARFLLLSGKPINEPVAWHGPIVMNTREELELAIDEYNNGTFIKYRH